MNCSIVKYEHDARSNGHVHCLTLNVPAPATSMSRMDAHNEERRNAGLRNVPPITHILNLSEHSMFGTSAPCKITLLKAIHVTNVANRYGFFENARCYTGSKIQASGMKGDFIYKCNIARAAQALYENLLIIMDDVASSACSKEHMLTMQQELDTLCGMEKSFVVTVQHSFISSVIPLFKRVTVHEHDKKLAHVVAKSSEPILNVIVGECAQQPSFESNAQEEITISHCLPAACTKHCMFLHQSNYNMQVAMDYTKGLLHITLPRSETQMSELNIVFMSEDTASEKSTPMCKSLSNLIAAFCSTKAENATSQSYIDLFSTYMNECQTSTIAKHWFTQKHVLPALKTKLSAGNSLDPLLLHRNISCSKAPHAPNFS